MKKLIILSTIFFSISVHALPDCPSDNSVRWNNCFGNENFPDGDKYVGEFKDDKFHGQGTYTLPTEKNTSVNGRMATLMEKALEPIVDPTKATNTSASGRITNTTDKALTLLRMNHTKATNTSANSRITYIMDKELTLGLMETNTSVNGGMICRTDRGLALMSQEKEIRGF